MKKDNDGKVWHFYTYTREQAIKDGALIPVALIGYRNVTFTANLLKDGYDDKEKMVKLIKRGIKLFRRKDPDDTPDRKDRIIDDKNRIIAIWTVWEGYTFMKFEDV